MKEVTNLGDKRMTVREVAEVLKCDSSTVQKQVKEVFPEIVENGKTTYLNEMQVTVILEKMKLHNGNQYHLGKTLKGEQPVGVHPGRSFQGEDDPTSSLIENQIQGVDTSMSRALRIEAHRKAIEKELEAHIAELTEQVHVLEGHLEDHKIMLDSSDNFASVVKYDRMHRKNWNGIERQQVGKRMCAYCRENSITMRVSYSGAYNPVYSYPMEAWDAVMGGMV